jgi:hypothetical protein
MRLAKASMTLRGWAGMDRSRDSAVLHRRRGHEHQPGAVDVHNHERRDQKKPRRLFSRALTRNNLTLDAVKLSR